MKLIYYGALEPLARQMIDNLREGITEDAIVRTFGTGTSLSQYTVLKKVSREHLSGTYDFQLFEEMDPNMKLQVAGALQEMLGAVLGGGMEAIMAFGLDPRKLTMEILRLRGVKHPERFDLGPEKAEVFLQLFLQQAQGAQGNDAGAGQGTGNTE